MSTHSDDTMMATCPSSGASLPPIYMVGGNKGGIGKSTLALVLVDQLLKTGLRVLLFETDNCAPDVSTFLAREAKQTEIDGDQRLLMRAICTEHEEDWCTMVDTIDSHRNHVVVVALATRTGLDVSTHGHILRGTLPELRRRLVTLWVIDRQRACLDLLLDHIHTFPTSVTHVVRNGYFGEDARFELYNNSKTRSLVESRAGKSLTLPRLSRVVADALRENQFSISEAVKELPVGSAFVLRQWREECQAVLGPVL